MLTEAQRKMLRRLHASVAAVAPIYGVSGEPGSIIIDFTDAATAQQRTDAATVVAAFDWLAAAQITWEAKQAKVDAATGIDNGALVTGDKTERIVRALALTILDELNTHSAKTNALFDAIDAAASLAALKTAVAAIPDLPTRTAAQLVTAIKAQIAATAE